MAEDFRRVFDEVSLHEDIIKTWGEHGAHNDVFTEMRRRLAEAADYIEELTAECRDLTTRAEAAEEAHSEALAENDDLRAERDALRGISNDVLWLTRLAVGSSWPGEMAEQVERAAARVRALLDPEDGE